MKYTAQNTNYKLQIGIPLCIWQRKSFLYDHQAVENLNISLQQRMSLENLILVIVHKEVFICHFEMFHLLFP